MARCRSGAKPLSEPMRDYRRIYASLGLNELNSRCWHKDTHCFMFPNAISHIKRAIVLNVVSKLRVVLFGTHGCINNPETALLWKCSLDSISDLPCSNLIREEKDAYKDGHFFCQDCSWVIIKILTIGPFKRLMLLLLKLVPFLCYAIQIGSESIFAFRNITPCSIPLSGPVAVV